MALVLWLIIPLLWNSMNTLTKSSLITSQQSWNTTMVNPSSLSALSLSQWSIYSGEANLGWSTDCQLHIDEERGSKEEGLVFKIGFENAYDHVDWGFLNHVFESKWFSSRWKTWIRACLFITNFVVLVNVNAKARVKVTRGLRQRDPLSHFLFTIVANVLSKMLLRAKESWLLEGFLVGKSKTSVSHLKFADDAIFFSMSCSED